MAYIMLYNFVSQVNTERDGARVGGAYSNCEVAPIPDYRPSTQETDQRYDFFVLQLKEIQWEARP